MGTRTEEAAKTALDKWIKDNQLEPANPDAPRGYDTNYKSSKDLHRIYKTPDGLLINLQLTGFTPAYQIGLTWEIMTDPEDSRFRTKTSLNYSFGMPDMVSRKSTNRHLDEIIRYANELGVSPNDLTPEDRQTIRDRVVALPPDENAIREDQESISRMISKLDDSLRLMRETALALG